MNNVNWIDIKLNPNKSAAESISKVEAVFKKLIPSAPFDYKFADKEFAAKFASETRVGQLSGVFAVLAIFISCLGLFGLASYMAEQRTKEIGVRKVLGASVFSLWKMLSKDFVVLVLISSGYRNTNHLLFHAPLVAELSIPDRNFLVGFCTGRNFRDSYNNHYSQLSRVLKRRW